MGEKIIETEENYTELLTKMVFYPSEERKGENEQSLSFIKHENTKVDDNCKKIMHERLEKYLNNEFGSFNVE